MLKFDADTVDRLFGSEDAESESPERLKQYFVSNKAYESITSQGPLKLLVGHKGVGKSALLRRAYLDDRESNRLAIWLQASDFNEVNAQTPEVGFNQRVEAWKSGFLNLVASKAIEEIGVDPSQSPDLNIGRDLIKSVKSVFSELRPKVTQAVEKSILDNFLTDEIITVYIDDIDRGWTASRSDTQAVSALINAIRDITNQNRNFRCRVALRTDVYYIFRTSDESTDKIETNIVWLSWSNNDILKLIAYRIKTYFDSEFTFQEIDKYQSQKDISDNILNLVVDPVFNGAGHWSRRSIHNVLLSLCRARPRDLIKLLHASAKIAYQNDHTKISSSDLQDSFSSYSEERLQDLVNEFKSEVPNLEQLLLNFKPKSKKRKTSENYLFTTDAIISRIKEIRNRVPLSFTSKTIISDRDILSFLYKIDFVTARKEITNGTIERHYFNQSRFLSNSAVDFGFEWEIHPAYRWALQPQDVQAVIDSLG